MTKNAYIPFALRDCVRKKFSANLILDAANTRPFVIFWADLGARGGWRQRSQLWFSANAECPNNFVKTKLNWEVQARLPRCFHSFELPFLLFIRCPLASLSFRIHFLLARRKRFQRAFGNLILLILLIFTFVEYQRNFYLIVDSLLMLPVSFHSFFRSRFFFLHILLVFSFSLFLNLNLSLLLGSRLSSTNAFVYFMLPLYLSSSVCFFSRFTLRSA